MKYIFTSLVMLSLSLFLKAEFFAVQICDSQILNSLKDKESNGKLSILASLSFENYILVEGEEQALEGLCYYSKLKSYKNHIAFNTNTLLIKLKVEEESLSLNLELKAHKLIPNLYYYIATTETEEELSEMVKHLENHAAVEQVSFKQVFTLDATVNDPLYNRQWSIENVGSAIQSGGTPDADMQVDSAWQITTGSDTIKVAVLDSGVDTLHEDLMLNLLAGYDAFANGVNDTRGYPSLNFSSDGHGTACAGIIAAVGDNNLGGIGIAYRSKIIPIRIFYYQDYGPGIGIQATTNTDALLSGSAYAWRVADADIMSTSAGLSPLFISALGVNTAIIDAEIAEAFSSARGGRGIAMFFSAGNDDIDDVLWPADLNETIAIGASSMCDERKNPNDCSPEDWGSSYGYSLDIMAPGVRITTTDVSGSGGYSNNAYTYTFNGTSAACPNAAGVGALILAINPDFHARDVKAILNISADRVANYLYDSIGIHGTWNIEVGHGRVNAYKALQLAATYVSTVGIHATSIEELSFIAYPNPSKASFVLENKSNETLVLEVYNLLGQKLQTENLLAKEKRVLSLTSGSYIIKDRNSINFQKLIVLE
ncbi:MAG: S8 family peptidase [Chitinophagales bacterium]|nr:S8 family peptidase [Chitinophagales bacterium]